MLSAQNAPIPVGIHFKGTGPLSYNIEPETLDLEDKMKLMTGRWLLALGMNWAKISGKSYTSIVKISKSKEQTIWENYMHPKNHLLISPV